MIDDLKSPLELHKFVDDCTLSEIIKKSGTSIMQQEIDSVDSWLNLNHMVINTKKTKEMLIGSNRKNLPPLLQLDGQPVTYCKIISALQVTSCWPCWVATSQIVCNYVIIVFQGGTAPPYFPANKATTADAINAMPG